MAKKTRNKEAIQKAQREAEKQRKLKSKKRKRGY